MTEQAVVSLNLSFSFYEGTDHTYEPTETVTAGAGTAETQARWGPSTERRKWARAPIPNQDAINS